METILTLKNLSKRYGPIQAVNNLSLTIEKGHVYGILGPNGSGKSTTLGMVLNVVNKTSGDYFWFDGSVPTHQALKKVGAIIERPNFYPYMSARENLELVCRIKEVPFDKITEKLQLVGLIEREESLFSTFSLGMKQRLAIASALLNDPEILILDEPTNGLDPQGIHQIRDIVKTIASQGTTILLASHLLDEVEKVCSHVVILQKGIMLYSGRVDEINRPTGYFELDGFDRAALRKVLETHPDIEAIEEDKGKLMAHFKRPVAAEDLNRFFFERQIVLSHLVKRQRTLEEQFLSITRTPKNS